MRNRGSLMLMEMLLMLLVFAMAAALCLQVFVKADDISRRVNERDRGVFLAQSAAEILKDNVGDLNMAKTLISCLEEDGYLLEICKQPVAVSGLGEAKIIVRHEGDPNRIVYELEVAWQEVQ